MWMDGHGNGDVIAEVDADNLSDLPAQQRPHVALGARCGHLLCVGGVRVPPIDELAIATADPRLISLQCVV